MRFWKNSYIIDVKWLILVREIRLTYLSLNYNFGNWFLCEKPPHTNLSFFSLLGWENQGHGWRFFGWFWDFSHYVLEDSLRSYFYGSCFSSFVIRSYYCGSRNWMLVVSFSPLEWAKEGHLQVSLGLLDMTEVSVWIKWLNHMK